MVNTSTTSSLAKRWLNAVAPSSCISGGGSSWVFPSPLSRGGLARSASGIFAHGGPFGIRRAVNQPLVQSISGFLALNDGKPSTWSYAFGGMTKTSNSSTGLRCSKYWTKRLAFQLSLADIITWALRPCMEVSAGAWGNSSFLSRLGDLKILIAPQLISSLTHCMLPCMFHTRTSRMICAESGLSVPHRYWLDIRARPSRMTLDFKAIRCGGISSNVAIKAQVSKCSNPNSFWSSLALGVRYRER